ncbi:60Kd inner membrane protein-domain-containing protein [Lipomyces kononenkoae]|uniref:60Kd inner membrane protein-domain-containing protein n=1 Tax=Lipomyces kononenkoae TaxID=34357 RepID=A0ACC3TB74_LIPKO
MSAARCRLMLTRSMTLRSSVSRSLHSTRDVRTIFLNSSMLRQRENIMRPTSYFSVRNNSSVSAAGEKVSQVVQAITDQSTLQAVPDAITPVVDVLTSNQLGYLESIGLAQTWIWPADIAAHILELTHVYTGLPWWAVIVTVAVSARLVLLPLSFKGHVMNMKMKTIKPQLDMLMKQLNSTSSPSEKAQIGIRRQKLLKMHGIKTSTLLASGVVQIPVAYGMFMALNSMAHVPVDGFTVEGLFWFQNLAEVDPYMGLSVLSAAGTYASLRLGAEGMGSMSPATRTVMTYGTTTAMLVMGLWYSAANVLFFVATGFTAMAASMFMRSRAFRRLMKVPEEVYLRSQASPKNAESKSITQQYKDMWNDAKKRAEDRKAAETRSQRIGIPSPTIMPVRVKSKSIKKGRK